MFYNLPKSKYVSKQVVLISPTLCNTDSDSKSSTAIHTITATFVLIHHVWFTCMQTTVRYRAQHKSGQLTTTANTLLQKCAVTNTITTIIKN